MKRNVLIWWVLALLVSAHCLCAESASIPSDETLGGAFDTSNDRAWSIPSDQTQSSRTLAAPNGGAWDFRDLSGLSVKAERVNSTSGSVRMRWVIWSRLGGMYLGPAEHLPFNGTITSSVHFSAAAGELTPVGHQRPWDALAAAEVTSLELRAEYSAGMVNPSALTIALSGARLDKDKLDAATANIFDLRVQKPRAGSRAACVLSFRIDPPPADPYAVSGPGDVRVRLPGGKQALAFLDQEYIEINDGAAVRLAPVGLPVWRAYLPEWPAWGSVEITNGAGKDAWKFPCSALSVEAEPMPGASGATARLRWEPPLAIAAPSIETNWSGTRALWSLDPAGHWSAFSARQLLDACHLPATAATADLAAKLVWRPVPFWNETWGGYAGERRPDSALAQRMDALLAAAARDNDVRPLVLFDGSALERQGVINWASHPLRAKLSVPGEMYRSEDGFDFSARWMRYCLARYAHSSAVSALLVTTDLNAPGASEFYARIAPLLNDWRAGTPANTPLIAFHPFAQPPHVVREVGSFEANNPNLDSNWHVDQRLFRAFGQAVARVGLGGGSCYEITAMDADATSIAVQNVYNLERPDWRAPADDNFFACDALLFDVWTPPDAPHDLRIGVHLRDRNGRWFQTLLPGMIRPGDWTTFSLDLTGANAHKLTPKNHRSAWTDYSRQRIQEIGLHLYSTHPNWTPKPGHEQNLTARISHVRGVVFPQSVADPKPEIALYDPIAAQAFQPASVQPSSRPPVSKTFTRGSLVEYHVKINKAFANPFDMRDCDLAALIKTPSGKTVRVPAFFNQLCERREASPGGDEIVEPIGGEFFTIRYRAQENGPHSLSFELREHGRFDVTKEWESDDRFLPNGEAQPGIERRWPYTQYPRGRIQNGRRPVEKVTFVPGPVTATLDLGANAFVVTESEKPFHGFVRVAKDQRHFEFDDGTFFYPIGPCLRSPSDSRLPYISPKFQLGEIDRLGKRGTYQYDDYFEAFEKAGISWARVWMCSWWCALEWRRDWPGYQGLGRYNLSNAWRMDYVVALAEKKNIRLNVAITNHGQFTLDIDSEWANNPYNAELGGPLIAPSEFFTRADAKIAHKNKLRYVAARYGHSPAVMAFALFSEIEFTEEYEKSLDIDRRRGRFLPDLPAPNVESWHSEMAAYFKSIDPNRHLISTHFSHPERGEGTLSVPEIDIATSNAYSAFDNLGNGSMDASAALHDFWLGNADHSVKGFHIFNKPGLVEEQGRHWMGVENGRDNNTKPELDADLHAGLWGSMVLPLSGATGYWWWLHIHFENRYGDYRAFAKFMEGEDFRPIGDEPPMKPVYRQVGETELLGRAMKSDRRLYAWIYHPKTPLGDEEPEIVTGATMAVGGLKTGKYHVEFWDTYKGEIIGALDADCTKDKEGIEIKLPAVKRDIAMKIKRVK